MVEEAVAPPQEAEEPDVPSEDLVKNPDMAELVALAEGIERERRTIADSEAVLDALKEKLLPLMTAKGLHGVRVSTGTAVRRRWDVRATKKVDPARLREVLADAPEFIAEVVEMPKLREAYPTVWEKLGAARRKELIVVYVPKAKKAEPA